MTRLIAPIGSLSIILKEVLCKSFEMLVSNVFKKSYTSLQNTFMDDICDINPYEVLGLSVGASQQDIRTAYKRLALRYHPDKPEGDDDSFKKIHQAYQILTDPLKKEIYDAKLRGHLDSKVLEEFMSNFITMLQEKLKEKLNSKIVNKKDPMVVSVDVDLKDVYKADVKKVVIKVADGMNKVSKPFYISLNNYQDVYCFKGEGDHGTDIHIKLNIVGKLYPHVKQDNIVSKYNLYIELPLSIYEFYFGVEKFISYFDEDGIHLKLEPLTFEGNTEFVHILKNKGLPFIDEDGNPIRGDLFVHFTLTCPQLNQQQLNECEAMFKTLFQNKYE